MDRPYQELPDPPYSLDDKQAASGFAFAQSPQGGPSPDGYMIQGRKVMVNKGGKASPMDSDTTLPDGTKIMKDGTLIRKDGTKSMMKDGDRMDMSGAMKK